MTEHPAADDRAGRSDERVQRYVALASGLTRVTLDTTERVLAGFVRQGEVAADRAERLLDEVVARSADSGGALAQLVRTEVDRVIEQTGLVRRGELDAVRAEVAALQVEAEALRVRIAALRAGAGEHGGEDGG